MHILYQTQTLQMNSIQTRRELRYSKCFAFHGLLCYDHQPLKPFIQGWEFALLLLSLFLKERREQIALVTLLKRVTLLFFFFLQNKSDSIHSFQKSERAICYFLSKTSNSHEKTKERIPNPAFISIVHLKKIIITLLTVSVHLKKFLWYTLYSPIDLI